MRRREKQAMPTWRAGRGVLQWRGWTGRFCWCVRLTMSAEPPILTIASLSVARSCFWLPSERLGHFCAGCCTPSSLHCADSQYRIAVSTSESSSALSEEAWCPALCSHAAPSAPRSRSCCSLCAPREASWRRKAVRTSPAQLSRSRSKCSISTGVRMSFAFSHVSSALL